MSRLDETWDWAIHSPVFFLVLTLAAYRVGCELRDRTGGHSLAQPVLIAIAIIAPVITVLDIDYADYRSGTELIAFLLGPATVALAIPLHRHARRLAGRVVPLLLAIALGAVASVGSAILLVQALGGDELLARTVAPKAATAPVAIALAERADAIGPLAAVLAIIAGVLGAVAGPRMLTLLRVRDHLARGLAQGAVSHGIGASRMLHDDETEGAFAGLSMGLTALAISLVFPVLVALLI